MEASPRATPPPPTRCGAGAARPGPSRSAPLGGRRRLTRRLVAGAVAVPTAAPSGESPTADEQPGPELDSSLGIDAGEGELSAASFARWPRGCEAGRAGRVVGLSRRGRRPGPSRPDGAALRRGGCRSGSGRPADEDLGCGPESGPPGDAQAQAMERLAPAQPIAAAARLRSCAAGRGATKSRGVRGHVLARLWAGPAPVGALPSHSTPL